MKRRYKKQVSMKNTDQAAPVLEVKVAKRARKPQAPRPYRMFTYRGIRFILTHNGENTLVSILNKDTNSPEPQVEVPRAQAVKAAQTLAKVALAEELLTNISSKENAIDTDAV